jgi:hypothetical protein
MSDNKELSELLKNIQDGLKTYGLKELNSSLETLLKKNENDDSKTELILKLVCIEYNINKKVLLHSTERGEIQEARRMAICLLFFNTNISIRKIAKMVFNRDYHLFIQKAIKRHRSININVKPDRLYKEKYDKLEQIIKTK